LKKKGNWEGNVGKTGGGDNTQQRSIVLTKEDKKRKNEKNRWGKKARGELEEPGRQFIWGQYWEEKGES